jgi:hypothetical protein
MRQIMKTVLFGITYFLFSIGSHAQSSATKDPSNLSVNVHPLPGVGKIRVIVMNPNESRVNLEIKNKQGEVLYNETIKTESFCRDLNFGTMKSDKYTILIKSKKYQYSHDLYLKDKVIEKKVDLAEGTEVAVVSE